MKLNRYGDTTKFISDPNEYELRFGEEVLLSKDNKYIVYSMDDAPCGFEELRPKIAELVYDIGELDNIAQRFDEHEGGGGEFDYWELDYVCFDKNYDVWLVYSCSKVADICEVKFEKKDGKYYLRQFGWVVDIPDDWTGFHADIRDYTVENGCIVKRKN